MSPTSSTSGWKNSSISAGWESTTTIFLSRARVPVLRRVLDEVVADGDDHVGVLEAGHRVVAVVQADGAQRARVLDVEHALAHERLGDGDPGRAAELAQRGRGAGADDAVAGQRDRVDRVADQVGGLEQLAGRGLGADRPAAAQRLGASTSAAMTSSGSSRCVAPGFSDSATLKALRTTSGMMSGPLHARVPLGDRPEQVDQVDELVRLLVHPLEVGLAGQRDERRAVEERVADRRDEVRRARAERAQADAGAPGEAPVHVGHVGAALLVANRDEGDRGVGQRLVEVERLLARDAEDVPDALGLEALHEDIGCPATRSFPTLTPRPLMPTARATYAPQLRSPPRVSEPCAEPASSPLLVLAAARRRRPTPPRGWSSAARASATASG